MNRLEIVYLNPAELTPYENNARKHGPEDIEQIKESIQADGFNDPIGIWGEKNIIVEGHGRQIAALEMGLDRVPCIRLDHLSDKQRREYAIRHNRTAELSAWDWDALEEELAGLEIEGVDLSGLNFDFDNMPSDESDTGLCVEEDDFDVDAPVEPKAKRGDIYRLGRHRLMCGDSTNKEMVGLLFGGVQPFCIVTDPPYCSGGFQEAGKKSGSIGTRDNLMIANDMLSTRGYMALIKSVVSAAGDIGIAYLFTDWRMWINLFDCMESSGFGVRNMIVWDKGTPGMGVGWRSQHEICLMASRAAQKFNPHKAQGNVIKCARTGNVNHPTEKPVELMAKILDVTDFANDVYDPFSGSGTTLIACEQLGRNCFAMELDPHYVDVIIARWETFTGEKAELINATR